MIPNPTKQEIYDCFSNANALLAVARYNVGENDLKQALVQVEAANIEVLLAKVRIEDRIKDGG